MPIITSLLDNEWYKLTMPYVVLLQYPDAEVGYEFTNRNTDFPLGRYIDPFELADEIAAVRALKFIQREIKQVRDLNLFEPHYLRWLREDLKLPEVEVQIDDDGQLRLSYHGNWAHAMMWETPLLAIISELVSRRLAREAGMTPADVRREGHERLGEFIAMFRANPGIRFAQFGARRRFSAWWEYEVTERLAEELGDQMAGISRNDLAFEFGYVHTGTIAHEYFMVPAAIHLALGTLDPLAVAQDECLDRWEDIYEGVWDNGVLCHITDTFGTDFYLSNLTAARLAKWRTFKQDSGDPVKIADKITARLRQLGLNPRDYRINHTDGLSADAVERIHHSSGGRYMDGYGIGTNLTNNVGVRRNSIVIKPAWVRVDGVRVPTVKLSDNVTKATGDPDMVERVKAEIGYTNTYREAVYV